jgi:hypothetical protein
VVAGAGFILGTDAVLTCAHVVNDVLGRSPFESRMPGPEEISVVISGPRGRAAHPARVAHWIGPRANADGDVVGGGDDEWLGDLAVLRVDAPPGSIPAPPRLVAMDAGQSVRAWHGSAQPATFADLTVKLVDGPIGYLDGEATGMAVGRGYSGGPLWSTRHDAVVGLLVAHFMPPRDAVTGAPLAHSPQHLVRRSWAIPWQRIESELRSVGALDSVQPFPAEPDDPAFLLLVEALRAALPLPSGRGEYARALACACGVGYQGEVTSPSIDEFATFLLQHPRAIPTLSEILRSRDPAGTDRILAAGRLSLVPLLLSHTEHARLHALLRGVDRSVLGRLAEAVRAALPLAAAFPAGGSLDALLDHLERLPGDSRSAGDKPRVPALLRVMEYFGALCPAPQRAGLREWSDGVAVRLRIPLSALAERRADAQEWERTVRTRSTRTRILAQVTRAERDRHWLRFWCDEGAGPRQVSTDTARSYTNAQAARALFRVLESLDPSVVAQQRPLVEVLVDRTGLNLAIDEWEAAGPDQIVPGIVGAEYPVVVHCPELLRRHERFLPDWRRRWRQVDSGATLVFSGAAIGTREIYATLMERLDVVRVSVDVPPSLRDNVVQVCLSVGVPVVLWDRARDRGSHGVEQMARVVTRELPDGLRSYRAKALLHPRESTGRPVLAWADADRVVPQLQLAEPQESA